MNANQADPTVLCRRLIEVFALEKDAQADKVQMSEAIKAERLEGAVCARVPAVGGRVLTFSQYFTVCFGETIDGKEWKPKVKKA